MKQEHFEVILEDINSKLDGLSEGISTLPTRNELAQLEAKVDQIRSDVAAIKPAVHGQSSDLQDHETKLKDHDVQIRKLQQRAA